VRQEMTWNRVYRASSYARSALWIVPLVAILLVLLSVPVLRIIDGYVTFRMTSLDVEGAKVLLNTVITLNLSFVVFTFGSLLVAIQVAGGQLTPRVIATTLLRDNVVRYSVGFFVFALLMSVMTLNRMQDHVNQLLTVFVAVLGVTTLMCFLFLIDYAARLLRPVTILTRVGDMGLDVIYAVYPDLLAEDEPDAPITKDLGEPGKVVVHEGRSQVILAVDVPALVALASRHEGVVEVAHEVGDFLAVGEPIFRLHGGAVDIPERKLAEAVACGPERTLEQDPMFAFRIIVDIGLKALSPAINDPTTGVLALDQVHRLLGAVGRRKLGSEAICDVQGVARVILRTPDWEDYVHLSCVEIRACGADNVQIARRMAAMLEDLMRLLPAHRRPALEEQKAVLDRAIEENFRHPEDLALARIPDVQGLGGTAQKTKRA
jgi:uncharacterized membrane protein